jgi:hypothetical protein
MTANQQRALALARTLNAGELKWEHLGEPDKDLLTIASGCTARTQPEEITRLVIESAEARCGYFHPTMSPCHAFDARQHA